MLHAVAKHAKRNLFSKDSCAQRQPELSAVYAARTPLQLAKAVQQLADKGVYKQLAAAAAVVLMLPLPRCCNNVGCSNLACESELQLVGGKQCMCAGCGVARWGLASAIVGCG